jgi:hypothetical protein
MSNVTTTGLTKAQVLAALYNNSKVQGLGVLHATGVEMSIEEADELLKDSYRFDYLHGKVMKISLEAQGEFNPSLYDRDNGQGAAQRVINNLYATGSVSSMKPEGSDIAEILQALAMFH